MDAPSDLRGTGPAGKKKGPCASDEGWTETADYLSSAAGSGGTEQGAFGILKNPEGTSCRSGDSLAGTGRLFHILPLCIV